MKWRCDHRSCDYEPVASALALQCSTNWAMKTPTLGAGHFIEQCSANAETTGSDPVEAPKTFFGLNLRLLKSQSQLRWSHLHFICMSAVDIILMYRFHFHCTISLLLHCNPDLWKSLKFLGLKGTRLQLKKQLSSVSQNDWTSNKQVEGR